jgi:hypothetical protein
MVTENARGQITTAARNGVALRKRRAPGSGAVGAFDVFIGLVVVNETKPATPVSQGGRGVYKPHRDDRDDL